LKEASKGDRAGEVREMALKGIRRYLQDKRDEEKMEMMETLEREKTEREKELVRLHFVIYICDIYLYKYFFI
jgi:hypothetical protein